MPTTAPAEMSRCATARPRAREGLRDRRVEVDLLYGTMPVSTAATRM